MTHNDLQNIAQKTKYWSTKPPLKTGGELTSSGIVSISPSTCIIRRVQGKEHSSQTFFIQKARNLGSIMYIFIWY
jgi:hypothetical protein